MKIDYFNLLSKIGNNANITKWQVFSIISNIFYPITDFSHN